MGRKKKRDQTVKPWCYYCDREFGDDAMLQQHQKARHFKCPTCNKRFYNAPGVRIHMDKVHQEKLERVPNALEGRDDPYIEISGMQGLPPNDEHVMKRFKSSQDTMNNSSSGSLGGFRAGQQMQPHGQVQRVSPTHMNMPPMNHGISPTHGMPFNPGMPMGMHHPPMGMPPQPMGMPPPSMMGMPPQMAVGMPSNMQSPPGMHQIMPPPSMHLPPGMQPPPGMPPVQGMQPPPGMPPVQGMPPTVSNSSALKQQSVYGQENAAQLASGTPSLTEVEKAPPSTAAQSILVEQNLTSKAALQEEKPAYDHDLHGLVYRFEMISPEERRAMQPRYNIKTV